MWIFAPGRLTPFSHRMTRGRRVHPFPRTGRSCFGCWQSRIHLPLPRSRLPPSPREPEPSSPGSRWVCSAARSFLPSKPLRLSPARARARQQATPTSRSSGSPAKTTILPRSTRSRFPPGASRRSWSIPLRPRRLYRPAASCSTIRITPLAERAAELLGPSEATDALVAAYQPGRTFAQAFADFYSKIFAAQGLLIVDASGREFHRLGVPVLRAAIERADEFHAALTEPQPGS